MVARSRKKKEKRKWILLVIILIILIVLIPIFILLPKVFEYKMDSRVEKLKEFKMQYPDINVAGWLKVQGTNIDYPILNNTNKIEYEDGDIQFLWQNGNMEHLNRVNYIMGHNILNLSANPLITQKDHVRFEQLLSFTYLDFVEKNKYIQLTIDGKDYLFKIFAISYPKSYEVYPYNTKTKDDTDVEKLIHKSLEESIFNFDVEVDEKDTIISLITCTRMFSLTDFRVDARLIRENEKINNYKVQKSEKYQIIDSKMKGVNTDDDEV